jgi:hypothetical protein
LSADQRLLKILSVLLLCWAIACAAIAAYDVMALLSTDSYSEGGLFLLVVLLADVALSVLMGVTGVIGANSPRRVGGFLVSTYVALGVQVATLVANLVFSRVFASQSLEAVASGAIMLAVSVVALVLGRRVRAQVEA